VGLSSLVIILPHDASPVAQGLALGLTGVAIENSFELSRFLNAQGRRLERRALAAA